MQRMVQLCNIQARISLQAARALYTGMIRPLFTCGAEVWHKPNTMNRLLDRMRRVEYAALRRICGTYPGSRDDKIVKIAAVEPLELKLDSMSACWTGRSIRNRDPYVRTIVDRTPIRDAWWNGGRIYAYALDRDGLHCPVPRAYGMTTADPHELSYRDRDDLGSCALLYMQLPHPKDGRSEYKALWMALLGAKLDEGCRLAYTDGCGRQGHHSYVCHRTDP